MRNRRFYHRSRGLIPLITGAALLGSCVTPMSPSAVERFTTCRKTTLPKIRKNLLLAGYEMKSESDSDLVTDWKQVAGYGEDKSLYKITVVETDKGLYKFRVRVRRVTVTRENEASFTTTNRDKRSRTSESTSISFGREVERHSDYDQSYYEEYAEDYARTRQEVCGR